MPGEPDRIELERSGGFANIPVRASVPTDALAPEERAGIDALLSRDPPTEDAPGEPDRYQYDITVVSGARRHHVRLGEGDVDEQLRPLIDRVERDATPAASEVRGGPGGERAGPSR
jgi:hypothetical protein